MKKHWLVVVFALLAEGCVVGGTAFSTPSPAGVSAYERRLAADSSDVAAAVALSVVHLQQGEPEVAERVLARAALRFPDDPAVPLLLAIAQDESDDPRVAYAGYASYSRSQIGVLAGYARSRASALEPIILRERVTDALGANGPRPLDPRAVAVLPLVHGGTDSESEGLMLAIAEIVALELGDRPGRDPVDPAAVRIALDEMDVPVARRADLSVGLEVGRRLGAAHVVQGVSRRVSLELVTWDLTLLTLQDGQVLKVDHVLLEGGVNETIQMQRRSTRLVEQLLTGDRVEDPGEPPATDSVSALAAFGEGLRAWDEADPVSARGAFVRALALDSRFAVAAQRIAFLDGILATPPLETLAVEVARIGELRRSVFAVRGGAGSVHGEATTRVGSRERPLISDMLGLDALTGSVLLDLQFVLPGGVP